MTTEEHTVLEQLLGDDPELALGYGLLHRFGKLLADRDPGARATWVTDAQASQLPSFVALAKGIAADRGAVEAALTTAWSNGSVEGHVHRVKLIKRQGYGRAKFDLLRRRVLAS